MRLIITGGPRTGKTTRALAMGLERGLVPKHTDDLITQHDWSSASEHAAGWLDLPGPWIVEGVAAPRALRKWLASHPEGKPCDQVVFLTGPHVQTSPGQDRMLKGMLTVWNEILPDLVRRGVQAT